MLRAFCAGQQFRFDILMDIGGFRDMHRHRRCIQIGQEFTTKHGYDAPDELAAAGVRENYDSCDAADGDVRLSSWRERREPKHGRIRNMPFRWASASGRYSRWTSPKWSTFPN